MKNKIKKIIIIIFTLFLIIMIIGVIFLEYKTNIIQKGIYKIETYFEDKKEYNIRNDENETLKQQLEEYEPFEKDDNSWYSKYNFISHGGGGIDGKLYTNSLEAYNYSYNKGNRMFDADLRFTSDGVLVLRHSWLDDLEQINIEKRITDSWLDDLSQTQIKKEETPTYEEFKNTVIYGKYTPMSFLDVLNFMNEHEDVYIACDTKENVEETYKYIVSIAKENNMEYLLERIIVSFYKYDDYYIIKQIYPFKNYMIRQQEVYPQNYYELAKFCLDNNIKVVNISTEYIDKDDYSILLDKNIILFAETIDSLGKYEYYKEKGIKGAITNFLYEEDLKYIN